MNEIAITYLSPERFFSPKQIGIVIRQDPYSCMRWLTWPSFVEDKRMVGAWCPAALKNGVVAKGTGPVCALVGDVDSCTEGALDRHAQILAPFSGVIVPSFNATKGIPKHRIVLWASRPIDGATEFRLAWSKFAAELADAGIVVDQACKNINRLYYGCATRSPATWLGARILTGEPVDVDGMLYAAKRDAEREAVLRAARTPSTAHLDANEKIARAVAAVQGAPEGGRHHMLLRRAYSLALDGVNETEIERALLPAFVQAAGPRREREGERAIKDAIAEAGKGAA